MKCISASMIILAVVFLMQSCINEDISECNDTALRLRFRYTLNNQYKDLFAAEVRQVTVYVFNADGKYVGSYSKYADELSANYVMVIPLPEGRYQTVVFCDNSNTFSAGWIDGRTGSFDYRLQPGITTLADFRIMLISRERSDGYLIPQLMPGSLYAGYTENALSTDDGSSITDVDLMKDTKIIKVKISGLDFLTRSTVVPDVYISAVNGSYKYDNNIDIVNGMLKYMPHNTSVTGNTMESDLKTMRLVKGLAPMLVIKDPSSSENLFNRDITELILSNPYYVSQEDIDRQDLFVFEINVSRSDNNNIVISLLINGWKINSIIPGND